LTLSLYHTFLEEQGQQTKPEKQKKPEAADIQPFCDLSNPFISLNNVH